MRHLTIFQIARQLSYKNLPPLIAITEGDIPDVRCLPRRSLVIFRGYESKEREKQAQRLSFQCRKHGWQLLIAGDPHLAVKVRAAGIHIPEYQAFRLSVWRQRKPNWLITTAAHNEAALRRAAYLKLDAALYSPVFATLSHKDAHPLGVMRFNRVVRHVALPVYALGGVNEDNVRRLKTTKAVGIAGISWWKFLPLTLSPMQ